MTWGNFGCSSQKSTGITVPLNAESFKSVTRSVDATALLGPFVRNEPFRVTAGLLTGKQWNFSHTQGPMTDEHVLLFDGQHRSLLKVNQDQTVLLLEEQDYIQQVKVVYNPPIKVIPSDLLHDKSQTLTSKMTVYSLNGKTQRDKGTCTVTLKVLGKQTLNTPAGKFEAIVIQTLRKLQLGLARGTVKTLDYYVPHVGLVAHKIQRKLITMGFIPMNSVTEVQRSQSEQTQKP